MTSKVSAIQPALAVVAERSFRAKHVGLCSAAECDGKILVGDFVAYTNDRFLQHAACIINTLRRRA